MTPWCSCPAALVYPIVKGLCDIKISHLSCVEHFNCISTYVVTTLLFIAKKYSFLFLFFFASSLKFTIILAEWSAFLTTNQEVAGSIPVTSTILKMY